MANYTDSIHQIIETASAEETTWLLEVLTTGVMPEEDWELLPEQVRKGQDREDLTALEECYPSDYTDDPGVVVYSEDLFCSHLIAVVQAFQLKFKKEEPIILIWATQCSSPRRYATGGTSVLIHRAEVWAFRAETAAIAKAKELGLSVPED